MRGEILWAPPSDVLETSQVGAFLRWLRETRGLEFGDYPSLYQWSVDDLDGFWRAVAEFCDTRWGTVPSARSRRKRCPAPDGSTAARSTTRSTRSGG